MLSLQINSEPTAEVEIKHPSGNGKTIGIFEMAGPEHPATKAFFRRAEDKALAGEPFEGDEWVVENFTSRTLGWRGVTDVNGDEADFDPALLPDLFRQDWLQNQMATKLRNNQVFFKS